MSVSPEISMTTTRQTTVTADCSLSLAVSRLYPSVKQTNTHTTDHRSLSLLLLLKGKDLCDT